MKLFTNIETHPEWVHIGIGVDTARCANPGCDEVHGYALAITLVFWTFRIGFTKGPMS